MDFDLDPGTWAAIAAAASDVPRPAEPAGSAAVPTGWKEALLAEAVEAPAATPAAAPIVLDEPPSAPPGWLPPPISPASVRARPSPLGLGERKLLPPLPRQEEPPPRLRGWSLGEPPRDSRDYVALLDWVWGPHMAAFLGAIAREPLFAYAARRWRGAVRGGPPLDDATLEANLEILEAFYDRLSAVMATYWDFEPAPLAHVPRMGGAILGCYYPRLGVIAMSTRLLGAPLHEIVNTVAHEQMHAFQGELLRSGGGDRDPYERSLVAYWAKEHPRLRRIPYMQRGIEIHAFLVGDAAGDVAKRL